MNHIKHLSLIIIFLISCSSEVTDSLEANSLISPDYNFSTQFIECKLNTGFNLVNLESFLSDLVKEDSIENTEAYDFKIYFPKSDYVNEFTMTLKNYSKNDTYTKFIDNLSNRGFDEIASCKYDKNELMGTSLFISDLKIDKSSYAAELLRCNYNDGYNFGTFRIAIERFVNKINFETKPLVRGIPANPNMKTQNEIPKNLLFFIRPLILSISKLEDSFPLIIENIVKIPIS